MSDRRPPRVLAVCLGNICRSPTAEAALREAAEHAGIELEVVSAGTGDWHVGDPPDPRMRRAAAAEGLQLAGRAQQVTTEDLAAADLVLAMDRSNRVALERMAAAAGIDTPVRLFREFDPEAGSDLEVPDPYYGGPDGFREVVALARRAAAGVVTHLADAAGRPQR